jgi:hypothetical protein
MPLAGEARVNRTRRNSRRIRRFLRFFSFREVIALGVGLFLLAGTGFAAFRATGALLVERVENAEQQWRAAGRAGDASSLLTAAPAYLSPFGSDLGDAVLAYAVADLLALEATFNGDASGGSGPGAVTHLRRTLELRPAWGRAWARLALLKTLLGQVDAEMLQALGNARRFAPEETDVDTMVLHAAVLALPELPPSAREEYWPLIESALQGPKRKQVLRWASRAALSAYLARALGPDAFENLKPKTRDVQRFRASPYSGMRP